MNKLQTLANNINEEEAGLIFQLLLSAFETANYQKVEYTNENLPDVSLHALSSLTPRSFKNAARDKSDVLYIFILAFVKLNMHIILICTI